MALINLSKKSDMSSNLFWKQPLTGVVENGVLKISAKSLKNICEGVLFNSFYVKSKIIQKITFEFTLYTFLIFLIQQESLTNHMINHVVYFGLN